MFGFSLAKLIVLAVIVAVVWYGFKVFTKGKQLENPGEEESITKDEPEAVDMQACGVCGDYVAPEASDCGKDDCPYPAA